MIIEQRINNNVVLANKGGERIIVMGKGIGFKVYPNDKVKKNLIEQTFIPGPTNETNYFVQMLKEIPMELLIVSKEIVEQAKEQLKTQLVPNLVITLADHLNFAVRRFKEGIPLTHPLNWEITHYYPKEMLVAQKSLTIINKKLTRQLPETEIPFLAMHFVNAQVDFSEGFGTMELTEIMTEIVKIVQYHFQIVIDQKSTTFARFVTHLRYYLIRQFNNENTINTLEEELIELIKVKYGNEFLAAKKISRYLEKNFQSITTDNELVFLSLHINRLVKEN